jgi:GNAT superfamily N-acetyltransferase
VIELDPAARDAVLAGLRALPINTLFVQSILCGHVDGWIRADDARDPRALYAVHPYGMSLLWGRDAGAGWRAWLAGHLGSATRPAEWLQVYPDAWSSTVEALAGDAERHTRVNFGFDRDAYLEARRELAAAFDAATIVPTTAEIFARLDGGVVPRQFWRDPAQFLAAGGGLSAIVAGEVAATAFCSFRHGALFELGIETAPQHRGKGLARLVASALIDACLERGLEPVWACRLENVASFQLARRLGFTPTAHLPYYRLSGRGSDRRGRG